MFVSNLQLQFQCCGYFLSNDTVENSGFCASPAVNANTTTCVGPITAFTDFTLNNIFTYV